MKTDHLESLEELPLSSLDLIDLLDKALPPLCILPNQTPESAHRYAGAREVIDELVSLKAEYLEAQAKESAGPEEPEYKVLKSRKRK